jgi:prepilin-type N-terminal cleavage/methylation domain-containing protein
VNLRMKIKLLEGQKGFGLVEILVALAILGVTAVGYMSALATSTRTAAKTDQMDTGRAIAQTVMEYVKKHSFSASGSYYDQTDIDDMLSEYPGYTVDINAPAAPERDSYIQKITVTVYYNSQTVTTLDDCKAKR